MMGVILHLSLQRLELTFKGGEYKAAPYPAHTAPLDADLRGPNNKVRGRDANKHVNGAEARPPFRGGIILQIFGAPEMPSGFPL